MKKSVFLLSILLAILLPYVLFAFFETEAEPEDDQVTTLTEPAEQVTSSQMLHVMDGDSVLEMDLDAYVTGVVLGEMPADFEMEALKAQAVATRTYTLRNVLRSSKHSDADVCTDSSCCQAFVQPSDYLGGEEHLSKVQSAVAETSGQVITYQGNLIEATYFSSSGGKTEDAVAVWGTSVPYLKSVDSPGEEGAQSFESQIHFSHSDFIKKLGLPESCCLSEENIALTYTDADSVKTMQIAGCTFSGVQARTMLSLPSTAFTITLTESTVIINTKGNGHRVGMSQYGAEAMAVAGKTYEEILTYYYSGTELETISQEQINAIFDKEENL